MNKQSIIILFQIVAITIFTVVGDAFLKRANYHTNRFLNSDFFIGLLVYGITAFLWVFLYNATKFSLSGVIYSILSMIVFVVIGTMFFGEKLSGIEYVGILMGCTSIIILSRFI